MNFEELERQVERLKQRQAERKEAERIARETAADAARRALEAQEGLDAHQTETIQADIERMMAGFKTAKVMSEEEYRKNSFKDIQLDLKRWGFPERYRKEISGWENEEQEDVFSALKRLFTGVGAIVAIVGVRGTGKTTIAAQLAVERAWRDWDKARNHVHGTPLRFQAIPYRKMSDLVSKFKPLYSDYGSISIEDLTLDRDALCKESDILIVDELHECDDQKMKDRILNDMVDKCYSHNRDMLLISNQTPEQFEQSTSESVLSRITEHGLIIPCLWESWRDKLADANDKLAASVK